MTIQPSYHKIVLAAVFCITLNNLASAANGGAVLQALNSFLREVIECDIGDISLNNLGKSEKLSRNWADITLISVQTEGCMRGNNWGTQIRAFEFRSNRARSIPMRELYLPSVDKVNHETVGGVPVVSVISPAYADDDGRCCPSMKQEIRIWAEANRIEWRIVRKWKSE